MLLRILLGLGFRADPEAGRHHPSSEVCRDHKPVTPATALTAVDVWHGSQCFGPSLPVVAGQGTKAFLCASARPWRPRQVSRMRLTCPEDGTSLRCLPVGARARPAERDRRTAWPDHCKGDLTPLAGKYGPHRPRSSPFFGGRAGCPPFLGARLVDHLCKIVDHPADFAFVGAVGQAGALVPAGMPVFTEDVVVQEQASLAVELLPIQRSSLIGQQQLRVEGVAEEVVGAR